MWITNYTTPTGFTDQSTTKMVELQMVKLGIHGRRHPFPHKGVRRH
jgi:hypothetical protein